MPPLEAHIPACRCPPLLTLSLVSLQPSSLLVLLTASPPVQNPARTQAYERWLTGCVGWAVGLPVAPIAPACPPRRPRRAHHARHASGSTPPGPTNTSWRTPQCPGCRWGGCWARWACCRCRPHLCWALQLPSGRPPPHHTHTHTQPPTSTPTPSPPPARPHPHPASHHCHHAHTRPTAPAAHQPGQRGAHELSRAWVSTTVIC